MKNENIEEILRESNNVLDASDTVVSKFLREKLTYIYEQGEKDARTQLLDEIISDIDEKVCKDWGNVTPAIRQIIQSKYKY